MCFTLRSHMSAAPPQGGLTQALGGRKAFGGIVLQQGDFTGFGQHCSSDKFSALSASVTSLGALEHRTRYVGRLRKRCLVSFSAPLLMLSFLTGPGESSQVRVRTFPLLFSATVPRFRYCQHPPPPNNSFKPTPHRGVNSVLCATLARCRRPAVGRLNSGVRRQKSVW